MAGAKYMSPLAMLLSRGGGAKAKPGSMKKGGRVKKSGVAKLHKGEQVLKKHRGRRSKKR
jgi:hypothetical protein